MLIIRALLLREKESLYVYFFSLLVGRRFLLLSLIRAGKLLLFGFYVGQIKG